MDSCTLLSITERWNGVMEAASYATRISLSTIEFLNRLHVRSLQTMALLGGVKSRALDTTGFTVHINTR